MSDDGGTRDPRPDGPDREEGPVDDAAAPEDGPAKGMRSLVAERFSLAEAIGGVRGLVESLAPGLVFVVVFVATSDLTWSLVASTAVAVVAVAIRLIQRTPMTQAFGGFLGVAIGVVWAWRSGEGRDYFAWGLWTNAAYLTAMLVSILVRWPVVGLVVEAFRRGWGGARDPGDPASAEEGPAPDEGASSPDAGIEGASGASWTAWRQDRSLLRRYATATWLWVGLFGARLLVQIPLYAGDRVGWLGTARLVMGVPLWALVLWLTWVLVRRPGVSSPDR